MSYPVDPHARWVLVYRWIVFLLAAGFALRQLVFSADYSDPGGPFRYLTIWALMLSFFSASRMLALTERRSTRDWPELVAVTAVLNALVVLVYWRLWFEDPALVNSGGPLPWWLDYYLHGLGPLLQWIDALFIRGGFRRPLRAVPWLLGLTLLYVTWAEAFVGRFNDTPVGLVTDGLPYPFLNSMEFAERLMFYATTGATGLGFLALFSAVAWALRRFLQEGRQGRSDSQDKEA
ncbi:MAG: hypothetical protein AAGK37_13120 [Pseudomonadota bacterium]